MRGLVSESRNSRNSRKTRKRYPHEILLLRTRLSSVIKPIASLFSACSVSSAHSAILYASAFSVAWFLNRGIHGMRGLVSESRNSRNSRKTRKRYPHEILLLRTRLSSVIKPIASLFSACSVSSAHSAILYASAFSVAWFLNRGIRGILGRRGKDIYIELSCRGWVFSDEWDLLWVSFLCLLRILRIPRFCTHRAPSAISYPHVNQKFTSSLDINVLQRMLSKKT